MLQNEFHIARYSKCDINEKADVLFEEAIKQKMISHPIHFCKKQYFKFIRFLMNVYIAIKILVLSIKIYPNV